MEKAEVKTGGRLKFGCSINIFDDCSTRSHYRQARFISYLGKKTVKRSDGKTEVVSLVKVSIDNGGLDVVDRRRVEKYGTNMPTHRK